VPALGCGIDAAVLELRLQHLATRQSMLRPLGCSAEEKILAMREEKGHSSEELN